MLKGLLSGLTPKTAVLVIILVSNAFVWYYCADNILVSLAPTTSSDFSAVALVWGTNFASLISSAFIGGYLVDKRFNRSQFLSVWMISGIVVPFASLLVDRSNVLSVTLLGAAFSMSLGIGLPACMGYFTSQTGVETRGRLGGMMMLVTGLSVVALGSLASDNFVTQSIVLAGWRGFGLLSFLLLKPHNEKMIIAEKPLSYGGILKQRAFLAYFAPWIMFSLVNYLSTPVLNTLYFDKLDLIAITLIVENGLIGLSAFIGGWLVDMVGRKRMAIAGFVALGIGYADLGLFADTLPGNLWPLYFHTAVDGIAWGILLVVFVTTVWGDLSNSQPSDKLYAMGVFPFFISRFLPIAIQGEIIAAIPAETVFSFTVFFLFLAVLPLVYAPETLPEKIMKERELKTYLEKAKEIATKTRNKKEEKKKQEDEEKEDSSVEFVVPRENEEEAEQLAEKYY